MDNRNHLPLPAYTNELPKKAESRQGGGFKPLGNRNKVLYHQENINKATQIATSFAEVKEKFRGNINPNLIYRIKVNQSVDITNFSNILNAMGGLTILSVADNRKGYWVVFADDKELNVFKEKLAQYSGVVPNGHKYDFFNAIDGIEDIPLEEKIGESILEDPLTEGQTYHLNIELWRMEDEQIHKFIRELEENYRGNQSFRINDKLIMRSFVLLRVQMNKSIFDEIISLKEIARIERPMLPLFNISDHRQIDISEVEVIAPPDNATGILVVDSGIISNHPLLEKAVGDEQNFQSGEREGQDIVGHGTAVAGMSIYNDLETSIHERKFQPTNWLFSAKVMYGETDFYGNVTPIYDETKLLENQLNEAIRVFLDNPDNNIKVVNISFGNSYEIVGSRNTRQFPLANLIDELALEYRGVVFVVSTGNQKPVNFYELEDMIEQYPKFMVENPDFKIINPATAALALTVGSIAPAVRIANYRAEEEIWNPIAREAEPSPFSRVGFGINGMIKPELVNHGGNLILRKNFNRVVENVGGKMTILSNKITESLFGFDTGTSFSAPKISNIIGQIANNFPNASANFLKNLLLQSTSVTPVPNMRYTPSKNDKAKLQMTGYGMPNLDKAMYSQDNRIVLLDEGVIGINKIKVYTVNLPNSFFVTPGSKILSVVLTFDPPVRATRGDSYLGNQMEFKLFHTVNPDEVVSQYGVINYNGDETEDSTPPLLKPYEVVLKPGVNLRNKGCHQKAWRVFTRELKVPLQTPITLVLRNLNKWIPDPDHSQSYCISLVVEHAAIIDLYSTVRTEVQERVRTRQ
ncbi:S8 family peptidase [Paenibacillus piscarius]|uniref:S8 family peptidase n=1 Tax=Paenibacillus piscarius TaxID=1089681 RepID=UPI001EE97324|nr:S8 family peptidase [Paenibacillus piscarius]